MKNPVGPAVAGLFSVVVLGAALAGLPVSDIMSEPRLLHVEPSEFAPIVVFEQYGERCINFHEMEGEGRQSCMQLDDPQKMVFAYTRMMTSALLAKPDPANILIIGLGGATLPVALHALLPNAVIDTVELDPAMLRVAERFFGYETGPRQRIHIEDGRAFVERAHQAGQTYDMVMLDAFDETYIPPHLLTVEFLQHVRGILAPDGLVVANSFTRSHMHDRESATYAAVFGAFYQLRSGLEGNRVIIGAVNGLPDEAILQRNAEQLGQRLAPFGIDAQAAAKQFSMIKTLPEGIELLRD